MVCTSGHPCLSGGSGHPGGSGQSGHPGLFGNSGLSGHPGGSGHILHNMHKFYLPHLWTDFQSLSCLRLTHRLTYCHLNRNTHSTSHPPPPLDMHMKISHRGLSFTSRIMSPLLNYSIFDNEVLLLKN